MFSWVRLQHLIDWTGAQTSGSVRLDAPVTSINSDTRTLKAGQVFVALKGENFDGNDFVEKAISLGALAIICEKKIQIPASCPVALLQVSNGLKAYVEIGKALRKSFKGPVVAITGSAGKSSTKDMVAVLLGENTLSSPKSFNNLLGVSKTLCLLEDDTRNLVLEMGMNGLGEIKEMCENFQPQGGLITNIGDAHIGKMGGREGIYRAKKELFDWISQVNPSLGVAYNLDDEWVVRSVKESFPKGVKQITYSARDSKADIFISKKEIHPKTGALSVTLKSSEGEMRAVLPHFGMHHAYNLAGSVALSKLVGIAWDDIERRVSKVIPSHHRGEMTEIRNGIILIDESYNSNPSALLSSLESVMLLDPHKRRVLVLGEMRELESFSRELHEEVGTQLGKMLVEKNISAVVYGVGKDTRFLLDAIRNQKPQVDCHFASNVQEIEPQIMAQIKAGDIIFVKGSRGIELDHLVKCFHLNLGQ